MALFSRSAPATPSPGTPGKGKARPAGRGSDRSAKPGRSKKAKPTPLAQDVAVSPFFADHTRAGLADRFNELRQRRNDSVLVSLCLGLCLLVSLGMNLYQVSKSEVVPFKVVLDGSEGYLLDAGLLEPMDTIEDLYIQREIRQIISGLRTVTNDRAATTERFNTAYSKFVQGSPGDAFLKDYFLRPGNMPDDMVGRSQRTIVEFTGPTPVAGTKTWTVQWIERTATGGIGVTEDLFRGSITVNLVPVDDIEKAQENPLGIYIDGIQWEKVSSKFLDLEEMEGLTPMQMLYPDPSQRPSAASVAQPRQGQSAPAAPAPAARGAATQPQPTPQTTPAR